MKHGAIGLLLFLAIAILSGRPAHASVEVYQLNHRTADEIIPLVQPVLADGVGLSGQGSQLIVRGNDAEQALVLRLLQELDLPLNNLRILVRQVSSKLRSGFNTSATKGGLEGGAVYGNARLQAEQSLLVVDGGEGYIAVGRDEPFTIAMAGLVGRHEGYSEQVEYRRVATGFRVRPRLSGDHVQLELAPQMESLGQSRHKAVVFHEAKTDIRIALGEWVEIGSMIGRQGGDAAAILSYRSGSQESWRELWVRVERVD